MTDWTEKLRTFYDENGISVEGFCCRYQQDCLAAASPRPLHHGAEAHVGSQYGQGMRVVVVSLDTGHGSADLAARRKRIEGLGTNGLNPHMQGTTVLMSRLLADVVPAGVTPHPYYSMINAAKCSGADDSRGKVPTALYNNCRFFAVAEVALLEPQLIVTQGNDAAGALGPPNPLPEQMLQASAEELGATGESVDWFVSLGREYLGQISLSGNPPVLTLGAPHPAARDGRWQLFQRIALDPLAGMISTMVGVTASNP